MYLPVVVRFVVLCVVLYVVRCLSRCFIDMEKFRAYITAMRLRTLPQSLAGVVLGLMLAASDYRIDPWVAVFTLLTAVFLQILSNTANELGDFLKGTDRIADRKGPAYTLTKGLVSEKEYKVMVGVYAVLSVVSGLVMIRLSFGTFFDFGAFITMLLGAAAISGALKYTLGRRPYGYRGLGDFYVFVFFGIVSVLGAYFVAAHEIRTWILLLPAVSVGCFSTAVLNVNNIRDMESDRATRRTIPVRIGERNAKIYQTLLIAAGWLCMFGYSALRIFDLWHYLYVLTLPLFILHLSGVWKRSGKALDPMLPLLVISTFLFALLAGFGFIQFLL